MSSNKRGSLLNYFQAPKKNRSKNDIGEDAVNGKNLFEGTKKDSDSGHWISRNFALVAQLSNHTSYNVIRFNKFNKDKKFPSRECFPQKH